MSSFLFLDFQALWEKEPEIILDTNVILDLYRHSSKSSENIITLLTDTKDRLWIPHQVYQEYENNKSNVINGQHNKYKNINKEIDQIIRNTETSIKNRIFRYKKFNFPNVDKFDRRISQLLNKMNLSVKEFLATLTQEEIDNSNMLKNDAVVKFIETLKTANKIGNKYSRIELLKIYEEADFRYRYNIPPGYEDLEKDKTDKTKLRKFGDFIVWKEILDHAKRTEKNILFVVGDMKPDWWNKNEKSGHSPRTELIEEFEERNPAQKFHMISLNEFIKHMSQIYSINNVNTLLELEAFQEAKEAVDYIYNSNIEQEVISYINTSNIYTLLNEINSSIPIDWIECHYVGEPITKDVSLDIENNKATYFVTFTITTEATAYANFDKDSFSIGIVFLTLEGHLSFDKKIDYNDLDNPTSEESNLSLELLNVIEATFYDYNNDSDEDFIEGEDPVSIDEHCIICHREYGTYNFRNRGYICHSCIEDRNLKICRHCQTAKKPSEMFSDHMCEDCNSMDF